MFKEVASPTLIAEGTRLRGSFTFYSHTHCFGLIEGDVEHHGSEPFHVAKAGWVNGNIVSQGIVIIEGRVDGDIRCSSAVRLLPSANVRGQIEAPSVEVQAGALLNGDLKVKRDSKLLKTLVLVPDAA